LHIVVRIGWSASVCSVNIALSQFFLSWVIVVPRVKFNPGKRAGFPLLIRALAGGGADKVAL
jgi:hypothetical protein